MRPQPNHDPTGRWAVSFDEQARLEVVDLRQETLRTVFHDIGAVVYFLRKAIWMLPGFTVDRYRPQLVELHHRILHAGPFVARAQRYLIKARKWS